MKKTIYVLASDFEGSDFQEPRKTVIINVLASDFVGNRWSNTNRNNGCPLQRAFKRAGVDMGDKDFYNVSQYFKQYSVQAADARVCNMFGNSEPIVDFSFEVTL